MRSQKDIRTGFFRDDLGSPLCAKRHEEQTGGENAGAGGLAEESGAKQANQVAFSGRPGKETPQNRCQVRPKTAEAKAHTAGR